jgi:hypothetical protein
MLDIIGRARTYKREFGGLFMKKVLLAVLLLILFGCDMGYKKVEKYTVVNYEGYMSQSTMNYILGLDEYKAYVADYPHASTGVVFDCYVELDKITSGQKRYTMKRQELEEYAASFPRETREGFTTQLDSSGNLFVLFTDGWAYVTRWDTL